MEHQERVAALFDRVAGDYDRVGVDFFEPIAVGLVDAIGLRPGDRAADIGCGRGAVLFELARRLGPDRAVGVDLAPAMVDAARADAAAAGITVEVLLGDAMAPPLPAGSIDVVASSLVLFFLPDPLGALQAWRALLAPGGRLGVSTFGPYTERWEAVDGALRRFAQPGQADARTTGERGPFGSDAGMEALLRDAGFADVRTVTGTVSPRFDDAEHWYRWSRSVGQRQFWEAIPAAELDAVRAQLFDVVDACRGDDGRIGFDQVVRYTIGR